MNRYNRKIIPCCIDQMISVYFRGGSVYEYFDAAGFVYIKRINADGRPVYNVFVPINLEKAESSFVL